MASLWKTDDDSTDCCRAILCSTAALLVEPSLQRHDGVKHEVRTVFGKAVTVRMIYQAPDALASSINAVALFA